MRFIIAIVLGTLMFQGSPLQLPRPRDKDAGTRWNFESTTLENASDQDHTREKRAIRRATGRSKLRQSNVRIVRIFHKYNYFLQVSKDGKVSGTKDTADAKVLEFRMETYGTSLVRLYNIVAKRYIAINKNGVVITEKHKSKNSLFHEYSLASGYVRFSLAKYARDTWLLTLKKNGKVKNARKTNRKMKATNFFLL